MKKMYLYTLALIFTGLTLTSCGSFLSIGGGVGGPVASTATVYDDGYNVGYNSTYGRISYDDARREALFLSDKMAYELGLTDAQYEAVYEINLDYLLNMQGENSLYGNYWARRNSDLFYVLDARQYNYYIGEDYFYRPVYWYNDSYAYRVYNRYADRNHFYRSRPADYLTYRGGRNRYAGSYYEGRFGYRQPRPGMTMDRTRNRQEVYRNGGSWNAQQQDNRHYSFGNASRDNANTTPDRSYNQSFGGSRQQTDRPVYQSRQSSTSVSQQTGSNGRASFGNASRPSMPTSTANSQTQSIPTRSNVPSNKGSFGGHR